MSIEAQILDGTGSQRMARVTEQHAIQVSPIIPEVLPIDTPSRFRFLSQLFSSGGDGTGTTNMNVDGSSTKQEFTIDAHVDYDIFITKLNIIVADTAIVHSNFGNVGALSTGFDLLGREGGTNTFFIEKATTGGEMIALAATTLAWGDAATSFELTNWKGNDDALMVVFDIGAIMPGGARIGRGSKGQAVAVVNDDLTGLTEFTVRAFGYRHFQ